MDRKTDFRNNNSNIEAWTSCKSDFNNKDQEWDIKTLYSKKNDFSTKD